MKPSLCILLLPLLLAGCAYHEQLELPPPPPAQAVVQPPPPPATPGSLWTERQGSLFNDQKARYLGDIVTVAIYESASASNESSTQTDRSSDVSAGITNLLGLERSISRATGISDTSNLIGGDTSSSFSGGGKIVRKENLVATLSTQVVEVLPNGNLRIEGGKAVKVNNETQLVRLSGVVRPTDISAGNVVDSKFVLDARIEYAGKGVVSDKQKPGWLVRFFEAVSPI